MESHVFYTIEKTATAEFRDRGSRFVSYVFPIVSTEDFKSKLDLVKKEHPKASHHCFAYRLGIDKNVFRVSDDGEPSGTAGRPILNQIDSKSLTDILLIVVRYFGGTLLGVPGLINAYKSAASMALQLTPVVGKAIEVEYNLHFSYTLMNEVMLMVKQLGCSVIKQDANLFCSMTIGIPKSRLTEALYRINDIHGVELTPASA